MTNSSNININVSSLTDRIDLLAQKLTAVESQLGVIQTTIPTNLPEFTDPIPVTLQNPSAPTDTTTIEELLAEIKAAIENLELSSPSPTTPPTTSMLTLSTTSIAVTSGGWNNTSPDNLGNATDGNSDTATGWGQADSGTYSGWYQFDFGIIGARYVEVRVGVQMAPGWDDGEMLVIAETSNVSNRFVGVGGNRCRPGTAENIIIIPLWINSRYVRLNAKDMGSGQVRMRIYEVKAWNVNIPAA